ncbi:acyltransferase family protein [Georgenia halophila]|uniref:Acyltransferase family protein n=1 Tax=Georgenia halophila TaxID=620889 RepID=A0ABP8KSZ9_9MICO
MVASASAQPTTGRHFRSDVQGLRAVAVLLVLAYHGGVPGVHGGYVGVDVFFVISGFLITTHLIREVDTEGRLDLMAFYARRARRILPAALTVLTASAAVAYLVVPPVERQAVLEDATASALYFPNIHFAVQDTNYLADGSPSIFQHFWSLGVEEQFYLFWPIVLLLVLKRWGSTRLGAVPAVAGLVALSFVGCLLVMEVSQSWAFFALPTRAWELGVGALIAVVASRGVKPTGPFAGVLAYAGLAMILVSGLAFSDKTTFPGVATLLPVGGAALVILCGGGDSRTSPGWLLALRPMVFVGAISYSLYLVHWPLVMIPQAAGEAPLPAWATIGLSLLAIPVAHLCYRFVEQPFRRPRSARSTHRRTVAVSLAASTALGAVTMSSGVAVSHAPIHAGEDAPAYQLEPNPSGTPFVPANLTPDLRSAGDDNPEIYDNGCLRGQREVDGSGCQKGEDSEAPRVVLFGDSHAASWYPALKGIAEEGDIQLDVNAKSSCQSAMTEGDGEGREACVQWRENVIGRLNEDPPDLVMLANYPRLYASEAEDSEAFWRDALNQTIDALPEETQVSIVADNPTMPAVPASCLSRHVENADRCAADVQDALDAPTRAAERTLAAERDRVDRIDLTSFFCNDSTCPAVIDDRLAYRDTHHLTRTFSESLEPLVREELAGLLDDVDAPPVIASG